jgi:hypothetical protein
MTQLVKKAHFNLRKRGNNNVHIINTTDLSSNSKRSSYKNMAMLATLKEESADAEKQEEVLEELLNYEEYLCTMIHILVSVVVGGCETEGEYVPEIVSIYVEVSDMVDAPKGWHLLVLNHRLSKVNADQNT